MSAFGDDFKAMRKTVWHSVNLTDGGQIFRPNLLEDRKMLLMVAQSGRSSNIRLYFESIESKFSFIQVTEISANVKCHEIYARRYRLYNLNLFLECDDNRSIWELVAVTLDISSFYELHLTSQSHNIFLSIEMTRSLLSEGQRHCLLKVAVEIEWT